MDSRAGVFSGGCACVALEAGESSVSEGIRMTIAT